MRDWASPQAAVSYTPERRHLACCLTPSLSPHLRLCGVRRAPHQGGTAGGPEQQKQQQELLRDVSPYLQQYQHQQQGNSPLVVASPEYLERKRGHATTDQTETPEELKKTVGTHRPTQALRQPHQQQQQQQRQQQQEQQQLRVSLPCLTATMAAPPGGEACSSPAAEAAAAAAAATAAAAAAASGGGLQGPTERGSRTPDSLETQEETNAAHRVSSSLTSGPAAVRERLLQQQQQQQQQGDGALRRSLCSRCFSGMGIAAAAASRAAAVCCLTCDCGFPWMSLMQHPCSVCLCLLRLWASRFTKCLSRSPLLFLRVSFLIGCALVLLLLLALYATFLADLPPPFPSPRFEPLFRSSTTPGISSSSSSSSNNNNSSSSSSFSTTPSLPFRSVERRRLETGDEQGLLSLLQMPLLSGAPLLQPTVSPLRARTETLQRLFGPERHITALLIAQQPQQQQQQQLQQQQQQQQPSIDAASPLAASPAASPAAAAAATGGEGLVQKETLKAIWKLTKMFEAEAYRGSRWRDVCKYINTDFEMGEVCIGIGVFGIYEAALGPIETSDDLEDAFAGREERHSSQHKRRHQVLQRINLVSPLLPLVVSPCLEP
ncbi:hypothetical protein ACSSS7_006051 [Eimeria intestinalis]